MEFLEVILSFISSFNNESAFNIGSIEDSIDSNCVHDFYETQFQDNDVESDMYLTNDDIIDKLLILLKLEYHPYLAPQDMFLRVKILLLNVFLKQTFNDFVN